MTPVAAGRAVTTQPARGAGATVRVGLERYLRLTSGLLSLLILAWQVPDLIVVATAPDWNGYGGIDYGLYMDAARAWLASGTFYPAYQLAGPYTVEFGAILYPPVSLWLFAPFTVLPSILWWVIPLGVTGWVIASHRPHWRVWPLMALCVWGPVQIHVISGNPVIWSMMFVALATRWPFFGPFAFLKASLGPFGLWGITRRQWWVGLAVFCALSLAVLPMWFDWLRVLLNNEGSGGILYSWQEAPMMLFPLLAWIARPGGRYGSVAEQDPDHADEG